jgi:ubiquinone/menaquinone biosynthesis C-methylase UbiE
VFSVEKPMSGLTFRLMTLAMMLEDLFRPIADRRAQTFGIKPGMIVVDYGCGPGRYTIIFSRLVGDTGKVYGIDIVPLAIKTVREKVEKLGLRNVEAILAYGYDSGLPDHAADLVVALDMFFGVPDPLAFLGEVHRITKPTGRLILDDGHERRSTTKKKLDSSKLWETVEENYDHLTLRPICSAFPKPVGDDFGLR